MEPKQRADALLEDIAETGAKVAALEAEAEAKIAAIQEEFAPKIQELRGYLEGMDKNIRKLMKKEVKAIFDGADKVRLEHGVLIHGREDHVTIPRDALARLEALGWEEAIRTVKSVVREIVEKRPIERIVAIGGDKKPVDKFGYEVKQSA